MAQNTAPSHTLGMRTFLSRPESIFAPPPFLHTLLFHPVYSLFNTLHTLLLGIRGPAVTPPKSRHPIRITCISDTHSKIPSTALPPGDLLIHCGDLTNNGSLSSIQQTIDWLKTLQKLWPGSKDGYRYIVVIAGNHDSYFDERSRSAHDKRFSKRQLDWGTILYLQHSSIKLTFPSFTDATGASDRKLVIHGAPQIPKCGGKEFAFQYLRGQDAWTNTIPDEVDILVTHNPPKWHCDIPENGGLGDEYELKECWRVKPTLHVCGHVHSGYGREWLWWDNGQRGIEDLRARAFGRGLPPTESLFSGFLEIFDISLWVIGVRMVFSDITGILWTWCWGGRRNGSLLVNAALTYQTTDKLRNRPQSVVL